MTESDIIIIVYRICSVLQIKSSSYLNEKTGYMHFLTLYFGVEGH